MRSIMNRTSSLLSPDKEKELVRRLRQSDEEAFHQLYLSYHDSLYRIIYYRCGDPSLSEDVLQETCLRIWRNRESLDPHKSFWGYLNTISRNLLFDHFKHQKVKRKHEEAVSASEISENNPEAAAAGNLLEEAIHREVNDSLPDKCRMIFLLSRVEGYSNQEIADRLGISKKTVENQLTHALKILRKKCSKYV